MPSSIENYVPQVIVQNQRRQALFAWGAIFLIGAVWMLSIISAPAARATGFESFSSSLYAFFGYICHQISERSFLLYEQPIAVCARCFGFYGGLFLGLAAYPLFRAVNNTDPLPRIWLFLAMIPMAIDWSLGFFDIWENTHISRLLSGAIIGGACAFFIVPAVVEINYFLCEKFQKRR